MKDWIKPIKKMDACQEALEWAEQFASLDEAWTKCERGDWMLWLLGMLSGEPESDSRRKLVLVACQCARLSLKYVPEGEMRPQKAIETAEAWARKEGVSLEDVNTAAYAAAWAAAEAATWATRAAARAAGAAAEAADAAGEAAGAAGAAWAARTATWAARTATLKECADIVREYYPQVTLCKE